MKDPVANMKKYTEGDMNTMRALYDGCQKGCCHLRKLLKEAHGNYMHYRGYSPVDLDDDELIHRVEQAIDAPASKDPHEWVNKKRFDAGIMAHNDLIDHHAQQHKDVTIVLDKWAEVALNTGDLVLETAIQEIQDVIS